MLDKLAKAFPMLRREVTNLSAEVERLKVRPIIKDGKDGLPGSAGKNGIDGEIGEQGLRGEKGERGRDGRDGSVGAPGSEGPRGQIGEQGPAGPRGPQGPKGDKGDKGERGTQGEQGVKGDAGEAGKDGASITRVDIQKGVLSVWIAGEKREVGKVGNGAQVPGAFTPNVGGGGFGKKVRLSKDNAIYIASESDFPNQTETHITINANEPYVFVADVTVSKPFEVIGRGSSFTSRSIDSYTVSYNGVEDMFSGSLAAFFIHNTVLDCPNAQTFDFSGDSSNGRLICDTVFIYRCLKIANFADMLAIEFLNSSVGEYTDGITFSGSFTTLLSIGRLALTTADNTSVGIDFGTEQFAILEIGNLIVNGVPGGVGISGLADSGNIPVGRQAMVSNSEFIGVTPLAGVQTNDIRWQFTNNSPLPDSRNAADLFLTGGAETIDIITAGVFEEIGIPSAGGVSWQSDISDRFVVGSDGVITYIGEVSIQVQVVGTATVEKVGGGSDQLEVRFAKNWVAGQTGVEKSRAITQNISPTSVPLSAMLSLSTNDNIRVIFANNSNAVDVIAQVTNINVTEG